jgi:hypothetical protein
MRFYIPKVGTTTSILEEFERNTRIAAHQRLVRQVIKAEVRDYQRERLGPRLRGLEAQRKEAEREHALAQAGGDADATEYHQARINRAAGEISEIRGAIGE